MAYAAYCKVDQANRPIAGVVNFCPDHLKDGVYDEDKFIVVSLPGPMLPSAFVQCLLELMFRFVFPYVKVS